MSKARTSKSSSSPALALAKAEISAAMTLARLAEAVLTFEDKPTPASAAVESNQPAAPRATLSSLAAMAATAPGTSLSVRRADSEPPPSPATAIDDNVQAFPTSGKSKSRSPRRS